MNQKNALWGSISLLIGAVIAILALVRGNWMIPLLLVVFAIWIGWLLLTFYVPKWNAERAYWRHEQQEQQLKEDCAAAGVPDMAIGHTLLRHVNHRISSQLKSAYPEARWEWTAANPVLLAIQGGIGRIRVYGIPDFNFADVELDAKGNLACALVKVMPVQGSQSGQAPVPPNQQPVDPRIWYETQAQKTLTALIGDLASRGYSSLTLKEDGSICIRTEDSGEQVENTFSGFPEKVYWPQLVKVLEQEGLAAVAQSDHISVAW